MGATETDLPQTPSQLISCVHGRDRRKLRNIGKHDLLAAIQHGKREKGIPDKRTGKPRWKFTFMDIVYITDETGTNEITSYVLPISIEPVTLEPDAKRKHNQLREHLKANPHFCSSHTVVVVDMSGSMRTSDVDNYRSRADAVYATLALDFIGSQLDQTGVLRGTDVVSVVEMRSEATVVFDREPITNVLYNKFVSQRKASKPYSHGKYWNALEMAKTLFTVDADNDTCALLLLFLSDGKPSDQDLFGISVQDLLLANVKSLCEKYGPRLTLGTIGFAKNQEFNVLENMVTSAKETGSNAVFVKSESCAVALSHSISRLASTLSLTKTRLSSLGHMGLRGKLRAVEKENFHHDVTQLSPEGWSFYDDELYKTTFDKAQNLWTPLDLPTSVNRVAIRKKIFGEGAERIVFQFLELKDYTIIGNYVAKDSRFVESKKDLLSFQKVFIETQKKAGEMAREFNAELNLRTGSDMYPKIHFLECWVYVFRNEVGEKKGFLVEKMLDQKKYRKFNGNDGSVNENAANIDVNLNELFENIGIRPERKVKFELPVTPAESQIPTPRKLGSVNRKPSALPHQHLISPPTLASTKSPTYNIEDIPQAFSHWSYRKSNRAMLVCDLQGVVDTLQNPPVFEFTDPAIHFCSYAKHAASDGHKFGRTDRGNYGVQDFFKTHKCNDVCRKLGLPANNC